MKAARIVKGRLERTTLGQVAASMAINLRPGKGSMGAPGRKEGRGLSNGGLCDLWLPAPLCKCHVVSWDKHTKPTSFWVQRMVLKRWRENGRGAACIGKGRSCSEHPLADPWHAVSLCASSHQEMTPLVLHESVFSSAVLCEVPTVLPVLCTQVNTVDQQGRLASLSGWTWSPLMRCSCTLMPPV